MLSLMPMRYLYLSILLAFVVLGVQALETLDAASGLDFSIVRDGAPYILAILAIAVLARFAAPAARRYFRLYRAQIGLSARGFLFMFAAAFASLSLLSALLALAGHAALGSGATAGPLSPVLLKTAAAILLACVVAITEELLFRGFVVSYLRWTTSAAVTVGAVAASALIFAIAHNFENPLAWLAPAELPLFVGLFLLGVLLAVAYLVSASLWCPIGIHAALVAFDFTILQEAVIVIDLSPWWLGGSDDVREAPLVWLTFVIASSALVASRKWLNRQFAIEKPFVGALTASRSEEARP